MPMHRRGYLVLGGNGSQVSPVTVVGDISRCPGGFLVGRWTRGAAGGGFLHLIQPVGEEARGELRHTVAVRLHHLTAALGAVCQCACGRVRLLPQPGAVRQQRRGVLLRQVGVLYHVGGGDGPGDGAPQGVPVAETQETCKHSSTGGIVAELHLAEYVHSTAVYNLTCLCFEQHEGSFATARGAHSDVC